MYTCALNNRGGIEAFFTVTKIQDNAYYIVADGTYSNQILAHLNEAIDERSFKVDVTDLTNQMGILSIHGPLR